MTEPNSRTSLSVLQGAQSGHAASWQRLYVLYSPLVYQWCRSAGWHEHDAEDFVQEVFAVVHRKLPDFSHERAGATFRGWLRTIATNKMRDGWRKRARQANARGGSTMLHRLQALPDEAPSIPVDSQIDQTEVNWLYHRAMELVRAEFDERTWRAFRQVAIDGRSPADVAADLGTSRNAVYIAKSRVLSRLRAEFSEVID